MKVKFVFTQDEVTAVFVDNKRKCGVYNKKQAVYIECYAHIGQHSECSEEWFNEQQPATPEQYAPLLEELKSIGYNDLTVL